VTFFFVSVGSEIPEGNIQGTCSDMLCRCAGEVAYTARRTVTCVTPERLLNEGRYEIKVILGKKVANVNSLL